MIFTINNTFSTELPADKDRTNERRQVMDACFSFVTPRVPAKPKLIHHSKVLASELGLSSSEMLSIDMCEILSGSKIHSGTDPYAMCYGGHQFGHWAGQLGDGRAINLFETVVNDRRWVLQLKGSGETPYSRSADGLAVLRSSIREHLCSEAMYHLGVPTTRSLSLMLSGDEVLRDVMYNGNSAYEKGAIVCRVAPSFIRFGNFQMLAARKETENLKKLCNYTIQYFYPQIKEKGKEKYIAFFQSVAEKTLSMIIHWQRVGFVHGVMNTDNMSILGLTIDYGPYGWLEGYDHEWTPNTTDSREHRYRYGNQPQIGLWNLLQLANALYPLIEDAKPLENILQEYNTNYYLKYREMMLAKLGLSITNIEEDEKILIQDLENILQETETDMTIFFRNLSNLKKDHVYEDVSIIEVIAEAFYDEEISNTLSNNWIEWLGRYQSKLQKEVLRDRERKINMDAVNPKYVLRNYMAQLAIDKANEGDYALIDDLYQMLKSPYAEQPTNDKWYAKRPEWARHKVGCSMLSCSS